MKGQTHLVIGVATGALIAQVFDVDVYSAIAYTAIGSVIPDIDEEHSTINSRLFYNVPIWARSIFKIVLAYGLVMLLRLWPETFANYRMHFYYIAGILGISGISSIFTKFTFKNHRSILHDPLIGSTLLLCPLFILIDINIALFISAGVITHYILDSATPYGLPLFFSKKKLKLFGR
ncbi:MAG: metal-dependent hydrolase [Cyclobacteriaceae bacterium]